MMFLRTMNLSDIKKIREHLYNPTKKLTSKYLSSLIADCRVIAHKSIKASNNKTMHGQDRWIRILVVVLEDISIQMEFKSPLGLNIHWTIGCCSIKASASVQFLGLRGRLVSTSLRMPCLSKDLTSAKWSAVIPINN